MPKLQTHCEIRRVGTWVTSGKTKRARDLGYSLAVRAVLTVAYTIDGQVKFYCGPKESECAFERIAIVKEEEEKRPAGKRGRGRKKKEPVMKVEGVDFTYGVKTCIRDG